MLHLTRWFGPAPAALVFLLTTSSGEAVEGIVASYGRLTLAFEQNRGQFDPAVRFLARGEGYSLFLTDVGAVLSLAKASARATVRMKFLEAGRSPSIQPLDKLPGRTNYFLGDATRWRTGVPNFARVAYQGLYPGITVVYYGNQRQVEYDLMLEPGRDPSVVRIEFEGADSVRIDEHGDLLLGTSAGELRQRKPSIFQQSAGRRRTVTGGYVVYGKNVVGVKVADYDRSLPLSIDPVLIYSTFLGGDGGATGGADTGRAIATDAAGNTYVAGSTEASAFPTSAAALARTYRGGATDGFVAKLDPNGVVVYSTYIGGPGGDEIRGIAVDAAGNAYLAGSTYSSQFPASSGALQTTLKGGWDGFVVKLNSAGSAVVFATLIGGASDDRANAIKVNSAGEAFVAGQTWSSDFPVSGGAYQATKRAGSDAFAARLNADGSGLIYSTFIGGANDDLAGAVVIDSAGQAYVAGETLSADFPVTSAAARKSFAGAREGFITKLRSDGSAPVYSTLVGGNSSDGVRGLAVDDIGQVYLGGYTSSPDFPARRASGRLSRRTPPGAAILRPRVPLRQSGQEDGFVVKLKQDGSSFLGGLFFGGGGGDAVNSVALNSAAGIVVVAGESSSSNLQVSPLARQTSYGGGTADAFVASFRADDLTHARISYLGGSSEDRVYAMALDDTGGVCLTGMTKSRDFPVTPGASQSSVPGGGSDSFVAKLTADGSDFVYSTFLGGGGSSTSEEGLDIAADAAGNAYVTGTTSSSNFPSSNGALQPGYAGGSGTDAFVTKLDPQGTNFLYSTYLGGTGNDLGAGIAVDAAGNVYVTGVAQGGFPTTAGAFQRQLRGNFDCFLAKLSPEGDKLLFSTYLGGSRDEGIERFFPRLALDEAGIPYVAGITESTDFPTTVGAFQRTIAGRRDTFVTKVKADGSGLLYSTYFGGDEQDDVHGLAVAASGQAYIAGATTSFHTTFPTTPGAYSRTYGGISEAFVAQLNSEGTGLVYSTYIGGSNSDGAYRLAIDAAGAAYVVGTTRSTNFPTTAGSGFVGSGSNTAFVAKLNPAGTALDFSNRFMDLPSDYMDWGIAIDPGGGILVAGQTSSQSLPVTDDAPQVALVTVPDGFVTRFDSNGATVTYATYLAGSGADKAQSVAVDSTGNAYVTGQTGSANFLRTASAAQPVLGGPRNAFVVKVDLTRTLPAERPVITGVVNYGSSQATLAPGAVVTITGDRLASDTLEAGKPLDKRNTALPTALGSTVVSASGRNLPLFSVSPTQIVAQLPYGTPAETDSYLLVNVNGISSRPFRINVRSMAVGILAVYKLDLSPNSAGNKFTAGDTMLAYVTGAGLTSPTVSSGLPAPQSTTNVVQQPERILMNKPGTPTQGTSGELQSFTLVPGLIGIAQARILIPSHTEPGTGDQLDLVIGWKNVDSNLFRIYVMEKID